MICRNLLEKNHAAVRQLYRAGLMDQEIASEMNVSRQAVGLWRKKNKLPCNSRKGRIYTLWHYRALSMAEEGIPLAEIASKLSKKRDTVYGLLYRKGWRLEGGRHTSGRYYKNRSLKMERRS